MEPITAAMIAYYAGDPRRIHHLLKVHAFARLIGLEGGLSPADQTTLEIAALVHDIGARKAETLYGASTAARQEALGPAEAETLLAKLSVPPNVIARVCYLVGHHHTYGNMDGLDYQILVEADFLVNLYEKSAPVEALRHAYASIFRTACGKRLFRALYPEAVS